MAVQGSPPDRKWVNKTMYDDMDFGEYEFHEFPMNVYLDDDGKVADSPYTQTDGGRRIVRQHVVVNSEAELAALKGGNAKLVAATPGVLNSPLKVEDEDAIRKALYEQAEVRGVKIDKRWSVERIETALSDAADVV